MYDCPKMFVQVPFPSRYLSARDLSTGPRSALREIDGPSVSLAVNRELCRGRGQLRKIRRSGTVFYLTRGSRVHGFRACLSESR